MAPRLFFHFRTPPSSFSSHSPFLFHSVHAVTNTYTQVWFPRTLTLVSDSVCTQPVNTNAHMQMPLYLLSVSLACSKARHIWFPQNKSNFWTENPFFFNRILVSMGIWQWNCHLWQSESLVWLIKRKQLFREYIMLQSFSLRLEQTQANGLGLMGVLWNPMQLFTLKGCSHASKTARCIYLSFYCCLSVCQLLSVGLQLSVTIEFKFINSHPGSQLFLILCDI